MKAAKANKEYSIDESQKKFYQNRGFDIKDDKGTVIAYGRGKTVPYDEYEKLIAQNNALKKQVDKLKAELYESSAKTKSSKKEKTDNNSSDNGGEGSDNKKG